MSFFKLAGSLCVIYWLSSNAAYSISHPEIVWSGEYLDPAFVPVGLLLAAILRQHRHSAWLVLAALGVPLAGSAVAYMTNVTELGQTEAMDGALSYLRAAWLSGIITAMAALIFRRLSLVGPS